MWRWIASATDLPMALAVFSEWTPKGKGGRGMQSWERGSCDNELRLQWGRPVSYMAVVSYLTNRLRGTSSGTHWVLW